MDFRDLRVDGNDDGTVTVQATIAPDALEAAVDAAFVHLANTRGIGLADAKTARDVRAAVLGALDVSEVNAFADAFVPSYLAAHVTEELDFPVMGDPTRIVVPPACKGEGHRVAFCVRPRPSFGLSSYGPVEVEAPDTLVSEDEVDALVQEALALAARTDVSSCGEVGERDGIVCDIETFVDGSPVLELTRRGCTYTLGEGTMPEAFDCGVAGMRPGERREFSYPLPGFGEEGRQVEAQARSVVVLRGILRREPFTLTDEWVRTHAAHAKTVKEFRDEIRLRETRRREEESGRELRRRVLDALTERLEADIPDALYEETAKELSENFQAQLIRQGFDLDRYLEDGQAGDVQFDVSVLLRARAMLRENFALDALYREAGLSVDEGDVRAFLERIDPDDPDDLLRQFEEAGRRRLLVEAAQRQKALDYALENAQIRG